MTLEDIATTTRIPTRHLRKPRGQRLGHAAGADLHDRLRQELCRRGRPRPRRDRRPIARRDGRHAGRSSTARPRCSSRPTRRARCPSGWCSARSPRSSLVALGCSTGSSNRATGRRPTSVAAEIAAAPAVAAARRRRAASRPGPGGDHRQRGGVDRGQGRRDDAQAGRARRRPELRGAGQRATAPVLTTGKPEALRISVGTADRAAGRPGGDDGQQRQPARPPT